MKKDNLLFGRMGSKDNDIKFFKELLPLDVDCVCEPFAGSFAVTRIIYSDDKYKKCLNDNDSKLFAIFRHPLEYLEKRNKFKEVCKDIITANNSHHYILKYINESPLIDKEDPHYQFLIESATVKGMYKERPEVKADCLQIKILLGENNEITNDHFLTTLNHHRTNPNCFIFLDPPYLFSDNTTYEAQENGEDMTKILVDILEVFKDITTTAKIMLIINKLSIIEYLFTGFIKGEYNKIYQTNKRKSVHLIITNY